MIVFLFFLPSACLGMENAPIHFSQSDRLLVIAPHPDDETIGAGGLIQRALRENAGVQILYLTHGDYNEMASLFYQKKPLIRKKDFIRSGHIRKREALGAMVELGLEEKHLVFLGYPDLGTLTIWRRHWGDAKPFHSFLTQISNIPYEEDFSYGSEYRGENIVKDFERVLADFKPTVVLVTAPFDLNPDHQAAYLYLQVALLDLREKGIDPEVYVYLVHAHHWPAPKKYFPTAPLMPPTFLLARPGFDIVHQSLTRDEVEKKKSALQKYESQMAYSKNFLLSFVRSSECYLKLSEVNSKEPNSQAVSIHCSKDELWMEIRLENPLDVLTDVETDFFGYRKGVPFASMPKIAIRLSRNHLSVKDGSRRLRHVNMQTHMRGRRVTLRIPLELLGNPDHVFVEVKSAIEPSPVDFNAWRMVSIKERGQ